MERYGYWRVKICLFTIALSCGISLAQPYKGSEHALDFENEVGNQDDEAFDQWINTLVTRLNIKSQQIIVIERATFPIRRLDRHDEYQSTKAPHTP